jgi:hypothetical protein
MFDPGLRSSEDARLGPPDFVSAEARPPGAAAELAAEENDGEVEAPFAPGKPLATRPEAARCRVCRAAPPSARPRSSPRRRVRERRGTRVAGAGELVVGGLPAAVTGVAADVAGGLEACVAVGDVDVWVLVLALPCTLL